MFVREIGISKSEQYRSRDSGVKPLTPLLVSTIGVDLDIYPNIV